MFYWFGGCYQDDFFVPVKGPRDANPQIMIQEIRKNSYTERGRPPVESDTTIYIELIIIGTKQNLHDWQFPNTKDDSQISI